MEAGAQALTHKSTGLSKSTWYNFSHFSKNYSTKFVFNSFFTSNTNKFEKLDAVTWLADKNKNTVSNTLNINFDLQNIDHITVFEKTSLNIVMRNFAKAVVNDKLDGVIFYSYKSLSEFLANFDPSFHLSKQSLSNYKRRKIMYKPFMLNKKIISFFNYVKASYPLFETKAFLSLCYKDSPNNKKYIHWLENNVNKVTHKT